MEQYLMYLRKSRMDTDYEEVSVSETLQRHRRILESYCRDKKLNVVQVFEEVVSGEALSSRPQMLRLLELINTGLYAGVVCIDIERLSRGSSMESGYIMQILQTNGCKIITPSKVYDLQNESDEQFTDMKFMFSRYELKTITKRLVRGRNQSASEGKFMGSVAPYGYRAYKLQGEKGNSLEIIPEEAEIVRLIFDMYGKQGIGYNTIAYRLNQLGIPSQSSAWGQTSITNILNNEVYLGKIRWRREPVKRVVTDGMLEKKRILNKNYDLYEGRHEPIITQQQWDDVKDQQHRRQKTCLNIERQLANPFASIMHCGKCGAVMKRNVPGRSQNTRPWYRCPTRGCNCRAIKCDDAENAILDAMKDWLEDYTVQLEQNGITEDDSAAKELDAVRNKLKQLADQQSHVCEFLEKGIYSVSMFTSRNEAISKEITRLNHAEEMLLKEIDSQSTQTDAALAIIPTTQNILEQYPELTIPEKNRLWKLVLKDVTVYRKPTGEIELHVYPNIPKIEITA